MSATIAARASGCPVFLRKRVGERQKQRSAICRGVVPLAFSGVGQLLSRPDPGWDPAPYSASGLLGRIWVRADALAQAVTGSGERDPRDCPLGAS